MKENNKLIAIAFVAPLITVLLVSVVLGFEFLVVAVVGYPIMVTMTLGFLFPINSLIKKNKFNYFIRLLLVIGCGVLGGVFVYLVLFIEQIINGNYILKLFVEYSAIGLMTSLVTFVIYSHSPWRVGNYKNEL